MRQRLLAALGLICGAALCVAPGGTAQDGTKPSREAEFEPPVRLKAGGEVIRVESPGYAAPCWADVDGDGKMDLLVGQFNQGKIRVFKGLGKMEFAKGAWLQAEGKAAEVPGVW
jgi:hypothetical protein